MRLLTDDTEVYTTASRSPWLFHVSRACAQDAADHWDVEVERWLLAELREKNPQTVACHCTLRRNN